MLEKFPDSDYSLSAPEEWAWERIRRGEVADMRFAPDGGGDTSSSEPTKENLGISAWALQLKARALSAKFIQIIATHLQPTGITGTLCIHIRCAVVNDPINLANAEIKLELSIENSFLCGGMSLNSAHFHRGLSLSGSVVDSYVVSNTAVFDRDIYLRKGQYAQIEMVGAKISGQFVANGSTFRGLFRADGIKVDGGVFLREGATFEQEILLTRAKIGGGIEADGSIFKGKFRADGVEVAGSIFLRNGTVCAKEVRLPSAEISGQLETDGSTFNGEFRAERIKVSGSVFLRNGAVFEKEVFLSSAKIDGNLSATHSTFKGLFDASSAEVNGNVYLSDEAKFKKITRLSGMKIGGQFSADGSIFKGPFSAESIEVNDNVFLDEGAKFNNGVNLLNATIRGSLFLSKSIFAGHFHLEQARIAKSLGFIGDDEQNSTAPEWSTNVKLILRNTSVGSLRSNIPESWPIDKQTGKTKQSRVATDLVDFTYDRLDLQGNEQIDPHALLAWIKNATPVGQYTPQPYAQLAKVLREMGAEGAANVVDIARHNHYYKTLARPKTFRGKIKYYLKKFWGGLRNQVDRYGVSPWRSLLWFGGIALAGAFVNAFWIFAQPESVCTMHFGIDFWLYF
ncbi:MAG: hypothetical protein MPL62_12130, partial [Alphaproteobacteria bacterium]|nr:hypothetical protein [Alphaproteobacteria bacterium]